MKLQELLPSIGQDPFTEPEIYALATSENPLKGSAILEHILTTQKCKTKIDIKKIDATEVAEFLGDVIEQVTGFKDKDGKLKILDKYKNLPMPNFYQSEQVNKLALDVEKLLEDYSKVDMASKEAESQLNKIVENLDKANKSKTKLIKEIVGIDIEEIDHKWEQQLLVAIVSEQCRNPMETMLGKSLSALSIGNSTKNTII